MKLTNHIKNNHYYLNDSVMRGTIKMTRKEYIDVYNWLLKEYKKAVKKIDTYKRDGLSQLHDIDNGNMFCFGVCATQMIAKKYNLKNYKNINYGIKII